MVEVTSNIIYWKRIIRKNISYNIIKMKAVDVTLDELVRKTLSKSIIDKVLIFTCSTETGG
jgi:hypothetical protein